jgi:membrane protein DedA with SNARE-associated domain/rhodanese-related sulfurtransferase
VGAPFGLSVVFFNVLLEQLGLPVPAVPTLIVAGALAAQGRLPGAAVWALAVLACMIGDVSWYMAGRLYGGRVMRLLCSISLTPDICVGRTQSSFERWGGKLLIVAKFIPGVSMVAAPLAGATRMAFPRFVAFALMGATLWVGTALTAGVLLRPEIEQLLPRLAHIGAMAIIVLLVLLAAYIAFRWLERRRFYAALDMARIGVAELHELLQGEPAPIVMDVRSATARAFEQRRIPGALQVPTPELHRHMASLPRDRDIVLYCTCPNEASAAQAARVLMNHGFQRVRPLHGGLDAWIAAGFAIEEIPATAVNARASAGGRAEPLDTTDAGQGLSP